MFSYVLKNAQVFLGNGEPGQKLDIGIEGDIITAISPNIYGAARQTMDLSGKVLSPGFIDIQNHSDSYWQLFDNPSLDSLVGQGITTILIGNCGASLAPLLSRESLLSIQKWHKLEGVNLNWQTFEEYATALSQQPLGCNVGSLIGYSTLRRGLVGDSVRILETNEVNTLKSVINESMQAGAFGVSTGLSYAHEVYISELELYNCAQTIAANNGLFSVHLRNESAAVTESLAETIEIATNTGVKTKISHFKIRGKENYHLLPYCLDQLSKAYHRGINIHFDVYPYDTVWQPLYSYLPKWAIEGGRKHLLATLSNQIQRQKVIAALHATDTNFAGIIIASTAHKLNIIGKTIAQIAKGLGLSTEEAVLKLIETGGSELLVFDQCLDNNQITELLCHPLSVISTDGAGFAYNQQHPGLINPPDRLNHPRCYGSTARFLKETLESDNLPLAEAIRKLTSMPARIAGFNKRGELKVGHYADITIFDPNTIEDRGEYLNPAKPPKGITHVFVNGMLAIEEGSSTGNLTGYFLKKQ